MLEWDICLQIACFLLYGDSIGGTQTRLLYTILKAPVLSGLPTCRVVFCFCFVGLRFSKTTCQTLDTSPRLSPPHASLHGLCTGWPLFIYGWPCTPDAFPPWMGYLFRLQSGVPDRFQKRGHLLLICRSGAKILVCIGADVNVWLSTTTPRLLSPTKCRVNQWKYLCRDNSIEQTLALS